MSKFCPECGSQLIAENLKFCPECGEKLSKNLAQSPVKENEKKQKGKLGLVIVGALIGFFLCIIGLLIIFSIYFYPATEILGQEITLAQMHSLCGNVLVNAISMGSCSAVNDEFYLRWALGVVLTVGGLLGIYYSR